jgi:hypothetical protein
MNIRPEVLELVHGDGRIDRHDEAQFCSLSLRMRQKRNVYNTVMLCGDIASNYAKLLLSAFIPAVLKSNINIQHKNNG